MIHIHQTISFESNSLSFKCEACIDFQYSKSCKITQFLDVTASTLTLTVVTYVCFVQLAAMLSHDLLFNIKQCVFVCDIQHGSILNYTTKSITN